MNYYETLGVSRNSEPEVIDAAYRALMKKYHPDRWHGDKAETESLAKLINEAYSTLRDRRRRRAYDKLLPPDPSGTPRTRPKARRAPPKTSASRPVSRRTPGRNPLASGRPPGRHTPAHAPVVGAIAIGALLGVAAIALATRSSSGAEVDGAQPLVLPTIAASVLSGGREQTFCIGNRASKRIVYTLYWGGTTGRRYGLDPGHHMIHSSAYSAAPLVEFFDSEAGEPVRVVIRAAVTSGRAKACRPSYSFADEPLDRSRWSGDSRFGLYAEERPEVGARNLSF